MNGRGSRLIALLGSLSELLDVGVAIELIVLVRNHCNNILLYSGDGFFKLSRYTNNFFVFNYDFVHEVLAIGDVAYLKVINLVADSLCPSLWLKNLTINGEQVLDLFDVKKCVSRSCR